MSDSSLEHTWTCSLYRSSPETAATKLASNSQLCYHILVQTIRSWKFTKAIIFQGTQRALKPPKTTSHRCCNARVSEWNLHHSSANGTMPWTCQLKALQALSSSMHWAGSNTSIFSSWHTFLGFFSPLPKRIFFNTRQFLRCLFKPIFSAHSFLQSHEAGCFSSWLIITLGWGWWCFTAPK